MTRPLRRRRSAPVGSQQWAYVADVARMRAVSRWTARALVLKVRALYPDDAEKVRRRGRPMWRVRYDAVERYIDAKRASTEERFARLETRVAELEDALEELTLRLDAHARSAPPPLARRG